MIVFPSPIKSSLIKFQLLTDNAQNVNVIMTPNNVHVYMYCLLSHICHKG